MASLFRTTERGGQLALTCGFLFVLTLCIVIAAIVYGVGLPSARSLPWDRVPIGLSDTLDYFEDDEYPYLPRDVVLSELLRDMAPNYGFTEYDIQAMYAAARRYRIEPEHMFGIQMNVQIQGGYKDMYTFSLAIAEFLVDKGYRRIALPCPTATSPSPSGPGTPEATPRVNECILNWKHHAIKQLNPDGGDAFLVRVLSTANIWVAPLTTIEIQPTEPKSLLHLISVLIEMVRLREVGYYSELVMVDGKPVIITDPGQPPIPYPDVPDGFFICPYAGCNVTGYDFGDTVYKWENGKRTDIVLRARHPAVDYGGAGQAPVVAACNGRVTYAGWMNSGSLWISGIVVAIECSPSATDSTPICTLYGHGKKGTLQVGVGQAVNAGDWLYTANNTGFSFGDHLHFGVQVGGGGPYCNQPVDPKVYIP